jgi:alpha-beta hydrolase superfamily lysophospholipase
VLAASEDRVVLPIASDKIVEKLRTANVPCEYEIFEGYGHAAFDEIKEYKERIFEFLNK